MNSRGITFPCLVGLGLVLATLLGCSGGAAGGGVAGVDPGAGTPQVLPSVPGTPADPAENALDTSTSGDEDTGQPDGIDGKTEEAGLAYQWPNPNRNEIFLPPASKPAGVTTDNRDSFGVALIGFANVDRQQVLLEIDGITASLTVGDSRRELQVLAIDPPAVTLQRGNREWTVKLFDTP